jgi:hypothetical protein
MIGKKVKWWEEERAAAEARQLDLYDGLDDRAWDYLNARKQKKLQEGKTKFNEPHNKEAEKKILQLL